MYLRNDGCIAVPPFLYFIQCGEFVKIGMTGGRIMQRMDAIQTCNPKAVHLMVAIEGSAADETRWHVRLEPYWARGEWFKLTDAVREQLPRPDGPLALAIKHRASGVAKDKLRPMQRRMRLFTATGDILDGQNPGFIPKGAADGA